MSLSPVFDGPDLTEADTARLGTQLDRVRLLMADGRWRSLHDIAIVAGGSEASISARLRDLRKSRFGGHTVERVRTTRPGVWHYRLLPGETRHA